jgi:hypothetical protein
MLATRAEWLIMSVSRLLTPRKSEPGEKGDFGWFSGMVTSPFGARVPKESAKIERPLLDTLECSGTNGSYCANLPCRYDHCPSLCMSTNLLTWRWCEVDGHDARAEYP